MSVFTNKKLTRKINIILLIVILFNFLVPMQSQAADLKKFGGDLLKELIKLFVSLGDVVNGAFNHFMLRNNKNVWIGDIFGWGCRTARKLRC